MGLRIHTDGGSRGNPGPAAAAVVVQDLDAGKVIHEAGYFLGRCTNNVAEYQGLIRALELAGRLGARDVEVVSDSELMVRQVAGEYRVKSPDLQPLFARVRELLRGFEVWRIRHVKREHNARADELANRALDAGQDVVVRSPGSRTPPPAPPPRRPVRRAATARRVRCPHCGQDFDLPPA